MATRDDVPDRLLAEFDALSPEEQVAYLGRLDQFPGLKAQMAREDQVTSAQMRLTGSVATLRQWADDARNTTVTSGNAVQTLQVVVNRLGTFFDRFADFLIAEHRDAP